MKNCKIRGSCQNTKDRFINVHRVNPSWRLLFLLYFSIGRLSEDHMALLQSMYDLCLPGREIFPLDIYEKTTVLPNSSYPHPFYVPATYNAANIDTGVNK